MTRSEGAAILCHVFGWEPDEVASMSDALVDWLASDSPYRPGDGSTNRGTGPRTHKKALPLHPTEEASLVAEGTHIAQRKGMSRATRAALANIVRIGQGRG